MKLNLKKCKNLSSVTVDKCFSSDFLDSHFRSMQLKVEFVNEQFVMKLDVPNINLHNVITK